MMDQVLEGESWLWAIWHDTPNQDYDMAPEIPCNMLTSTSNQCHFYFCSFPFQYDFPMCTEAIDMMPVIINMWKHIVVCMLLVSPLFLFYSESKMLCLSCFDPSPSFGATEKLLTTKNVHFMKLSKCVTDFTIAFLSSRWSKKHIWNVQFGVRMRELCLRENI
jgi:hypothetical protein